MLCSSSCWSSVHIRPALLSSCCSWQASGSFTALNYIKNSPGCCVPKCSLLLAAWLVTDWHVFYHSILYAGVDLVAAHTSSYTRLLLQTLPIHVACTLHWRIAGGLLRGFRTYQIHPCQQCLLACHQCFSWMNAGVLQLKPTVHTNKANKRNNDSNKNYS